LAMKIVAGEFKADAGRHQRITREKEVQGET
jgi:hypothetical protein